MKDKLNLLFQGDSITACGRPLDLEGISYCESLGYGYVKSLAGRLPFDFPEYHWNVINRGVNGNTVTRLYGRWELDTINREPDILSILIGVNDVWHGLKHEGRESYGVGPVHFERTYRTLLEYTREAFPKVKFILGQPFLLKGKFWSEELEEGVELRQAIVREIASEFDAPCVDYQKAFRAALRLIDSEALSSDGIHPTNIGNTVMADAWMESFKELI